MDSHVRVRIRASGVVEVEAGEVGLGLAEFAVGIAAGDGGLAWDYLARSFGVFTCVMVGVEAVFGGEAAVARLQPPVTSEQFDCWEYLVFVSLWEVREGLLTVHCAGVDGWPSVSAMGLAVAVIGWGRGEAARIKW